MPIINHKLDAIRSVALEQLGFGAVITDQSANILYVNKAFETITGYTSDEAVGRKMSILKSGHQSEEFYTELWRAIQEDGQWNGILWNRRKNGEVYHERLNIHRFADSEGAVNYIGVFSDISEQDELQRALIDAQKRELMATLVGGIAHNFNNCMAAIQGFAYFGEKISTDDKVKHCFSEIVQASNRTSNLVQDLMKISRSPKSHENTCDLVSTMKEVSKTAKSILPECIEFDVKIPEGESYQIKGNDSDIEQVVLNLVANARDALKNRKNVRQQIMLELWKSYKAPEDCNKYCPRARYCPIHSAEHLIVKIKDNGDGIPEEIQGKIFDPFFTTKMPDQGTGLGLASVDQIVNRMGGTIWCTSRMDVGTSFYICLPYVAPFAGNTSESAA